MKARRLIGSEIDCARSLAARVLVEEQRWQLPPKSPAHLRVEGGQLMDDYDAVAKWFGVFHAGELVACHRVCTRLEGCFELERYWSGAPSMVLQESNAAEMTRFVVDQAHRRGQASMALIYAEWTSLLSEGIELLFTTSRFPRPGNHYVRTFGLSKYDVPFRYRPDELEPVYLCFVRRNRIEAVVEELARQLAAFPSD